MIDNWARRCIVNIDNENSVHQINEKKIGEILKAVPFVTINHW